MSASDSPRLDPSKLVLVRDEMLRFFAEDDRPPIEVSEAGLVTVTMERAIPGARREPLWRLDWGRGAGPGGGDRRRRQQSHCRSDAAERRAALAGGRSGEGVVITSVNAGRPMRSLARAHATEAQANDLGNRENGT